MRKISYPCKRCTRVANPEQCDSKRCQRWSKWFLQQWDYIHGWHLKYGGKV